VRQEATPKVVVGYYAERKTGISSPIANVVSNDNSMPAFNASAAAEAFLFDWSLPQSFETWYPDGVQPFDYSATVGMT
jgi:hypothetical protein